MPVKKSTLARFKLFRSIAKPEYKRAVESVIQMYENRNISKEKEAENILRKIVGPRPQSGVKLLSKYSGKPSEIGKLSRPTAKTLSKQTKKYFINGTVKTSQTWIETRRGKEHKHTKMTSLVAHPFAQTIEAKTPEEAKAIYKRLAENDFNQSGYHLEESVDDAGITIEKVVDVSELNASPTKTRKMKAATKVQYEFIPSNDDLDTGAGYCVPDQFLGCYGPLIKKLTMRYFIDLCCEFYGVSPLDFGMDRDDDVWSLDQGVCSECLLSICKKLNISCYGFDVTKKCFIKNVAPSRNYPVLVYYSVNQHVLDY